MMSDAVVKSVGKKLKYYFDVKRLEDGFDLSGVHSPQLDHPPLKSRPTLQYDGLHDRALKHYFSLPEVRVKLTKMGMGEEYCREQYVRKKLKKSMDKHNFLPTAPDEEVFPRKKRIKSAGPSTIPEYCYVETKDGKKLKKEMIEFQAWYRTQQRYRPLKGGWPVLRSVPARNMSKGEAHRLVNAASKILIATEAVDGVAPSKSTKRPQSAPSPFETNKSLPSREQHDQKKLRPTPGKYTWDIHGRRHRNVKVKGRRYDDSADSAYTTRTSSMSSDYQRKKLKEEKKPVKLGNEQIDEVFLPPPPKPPAQKRRTHIICRDEPTDDDVLRHHSTQTKDNVGIQTEKRLIDDYDQDEEEVKQGDWGEYQIYVKTGDRIGASTKADIKLTVYGEKGRSKEFYLDRSKRHKITFQKGKEDLFMKAFPHVGKLKKIRIGHDRTELSYAWFLESVTIYDMRDKRVYDFPCYKWLSGQDDDKKTYRVLQMTNDRAFIEKFEEESDTVKDRKQSSSSSSSSSSSDSGDSDPEEDKKNPTKVSIVVRRSSKPDSGSESVSSASSDSSSSSKPTAEKRPITPVQQTRKEEPRGQGPTTFTFRERVSEDVQETESSTDTSTSPKHVSVDSSSESTSTIKPEKEFIHGYKVGLEAVHEEERKKKDEENEERKRVLRGPSIHSAAKIGSLKRVQELLQYFPEMIHSKDEKGLTPLHIATKNGQLDIVKWLAVNGASLNKETPTGYTPIHLAAMSGHVNCLMVLAALGAAITCRSTDKKTPLYLAAMEGHLECVKWLIANRARLDAKDDMGRTPHDIAEEYHHKEVADFLKACEDEMKDPHSGFAQMRTADKKSDDNSSPTETKDIWKDDENPKKLATGESDSEDEKSRSSQKELEEKKKMYEDQHKKMEKTGESFLDSIRHELSPEP